MKCFKPYENTEIYAMPSEKFKTFSVSFHFFTQLTKENVTKNALFPFVMKLGSEKYPDMIKINRTLQSFYGGSFGTNVRKKGDMHVIDFTFEFLKPQFCDDNHMEKCIDFINEVILHPLKENDGFSKEYLATEKENLIDYIKGVVNDKKEYTSVRLIEEMFKDDNYSLFEYGDIENIEKTQPKELYEHYLNVINTAPLIVFINGDINYDNFVSKIKLFEKDRKEFPKNSIYNKNLQTPTITKESKELVQGKFALGFQTAVEPESDDYFALTLFNSVFGSGPTSKLFMNVREKMSLCYYVFSRLDRFKGIMTVEIGCDQDKFEIAYNEILKQLSDCQNANITEEELNFAKKFLIGILKQTEDNQRSVSEYYLTGILCHKSISPEEYILKLENLTIEDIKRVSKNVKLQTQYFLS